MRRQLVLLAATTLLITTLARVLNNGLLAGDQAYKALLRTPLHLPEQAIIFISVLLAITTFILIKTYTQTRNVPPETLFVLALSPAYMTAATTEAHSLLLGLLAATLLLTHKHPLASLIAITACIIHPAGLVIALAYAAVLIARKQPLLASATILVSTAALLLIQEQLIVDIRIAELQALMGTSILILLLAVIGAVIIWSQNTYTWLLLSLTIATSGLLVPELRLTAAIAAAIPAGHALRILRKRRWNLETIKSTTLLFILLVLLFTATSSAAVNMRAAPSADLLTTTSIFTELGYEEDVFTLSNQEHALQWHGIQTTQANKQTILTYRDADLLAQQATTFIVLENSYEAENLRFVLENSRSYVRLHAASHELWRHVPR